MQKVYVLLRNNQQNGPFSLEELLQFDLKPVDLIWIEGKSAGWYYPQEIEALHPYLPFVQKASAPVAAIPAQQEQKIFAETAKPKKVFVAMPATAVEEPVVKKPSVENTAAREEAFKPAATITAVPEEKEPIITGYKRTLEEVESDYTSWVYNQKTKKRKKPVSAKGALAALLITGVAFGAWIILKSGDNKTAANTVIENPVPTNDSTAEEELTTQVSNRPAVPAKKKAGTDAKKPVVKKEDSEPAVTIKPEKNIAVVTASGEEEKNYEAGTVINEEETAVEEKKSEPVADTEAPKEKKKLGEKILDLFKKKPANNKTEEAKPAEEEGGERRTTRREGTANLAQQVSVKINVPNEWMMGIKGAKLSLANRSNETVVKAVIEVSYYNEDNELLQTKTVTLSNIAASKTGAVAIPDHSFADHLDYKIISVTGAGEPFARR